MNVLLCRFSVDICRLHFIWYNLAPVVMLIVLDEAFSTSYCTG